MKLKVFCFPIMVLVTGTTAERIASGQAENDRRLATMNTSQTLSVIINDVRLSDEQVAALERRFRIPMRDGNYWYERRAGGWGLKGDRLPVSRCRAWMSAGRSKPMPPMAIPAFS
jgi:hypothetical protein